MTADDRPQAAFARWTSLARPLDPGWVTNRAVLALIPLGGLLTGARAAMLPWPGAPHPLLAGGLGAAVVLGSWALARELAPDDQAAAFVALGVGAVTFLVRPDASVLLLFTALGLARMLARTVGPPAKVTDAAGLVALVGWAMVSTRSLGTALVGGFAFALDAALPGGRRRQWGFAVLCPILAGVLAQTRQSAADAGPDFSPASLGLPLAVALLFVSAMVRARRLEATTDLTDAPLALSRVRAAMLVSLLMPVQLVWTGSEGAVRGALVWAVLAGVGLASLRWRAPRTVTASPRGPSR